MFERFHYCSDQVEKLLGIYVVVYYCIGKVGWSRHVSVMVFVHAAYTYTDGRKTLHIILVKHYNDTIAVTKQKNYEAFM